MMRRVSIGFQILALLALAPEAHGFECTKAALPVDFVICSDPDTFKANEGHERAWFETRARLSPVQKTDLLNDQRQWLKTYPPRAAFPPREIDLQAFQGRRSNAWQKLYMPAWNSSGNTPDRRASNRATWLETLLWQRKQILVGRSQGKLNRKVLRLAESPLKI